MLLVISLAIAQLLSQNEVPRFESTTNEVILDVQVLDNRTNQPIPGLQSHDFEVLDDGMPVTLASFRADTIPLDIALAIDVSGGFAHNGAKLFSEELFQRLSPEDRIGIVSFARRTRQRLPLTASEAPFRRAIRSTFLDDRDFATTSCLYDGLWDSAQMLDEIEARRRRVVLALSHDREGRSRRNADDIVQVMLAKSIHFEGVSLTQTQQKRKIMSGFGISRPGASRTVPIPDPPPVEVLPSLASMKPIADRTGGLIEHFDEPTKRSAAPPQNDPSRTEVKQAVDDLVRRLRAIYRMSFAGQRADHATFRTLEVRLTEDARARHPNAAIYSRSGYLAEP